jgi:excisionase family DNA binding protein
MPDAIGPGEAARRLGVSPRTVQRWLREGRLPAVRIGHRVKVDPRVFRGPQEPAGPGRVGRPIHRLLVANRGELAVRIARTCRTLGIRAMAAVATGQRLAWWATQVDEQIPIASDYLDAPEIIRAARDAGADAIHPGYGFLAESADFADAVIAAGLVWIGPPPGAMRLLGDKAAARQLAARVGVPVMGGYDGRAQSDAVLAREADRIGYPVIVKPTAGGGGKGMHVVRERAELRETLARARREAKASFGDERVVLERYLDRPRHVEVQILFDEQGHGVHLGERDCSLQRRHQKVIEESPAPGVDAALRSRLGDAALLLAREAGYVGAGTVEFLLDDSGDFDFLEMNARLQVEHPVTEAVTGRDLVADQIRIASGERLGLQQEDLVLNGHAVEARLYAEDPWNGFLPATGTVRGVEWPSGAGIRVDAGAGLNDEIGTRYDPLLAKLIASGPSRTEALDRMRAALDSTRLLGVTTNRAFLRSLMDVPEVAEGNARTDTIAIRWHPTAPAIPDVAWVSAATALARTADSTGGARPGFRLNANPMLRLRADDQERVVPLAFARDPAPAGATPTPTTVIDVRDGRAGVLVDADGRSIWITLSGPPETGALAAAGAGDPAHATAVTAPMPGTVLAVGVAAGQQVEAHEVLIVLEAMKMENAVTAPASGRVGRVLVKAGQAVQRGEALVELA